MDYLRRKYILVKKKRTFGLKGSGAGDYVKSLSFCRAGNGEPLFNCTISSSTYYPSRCPAIPHILPVCWKTEWSVGRRYSGPDEDGASGGKCMHLLTRSHSIQTNEPMPPVFSRSLTLSTRAHCHHCCSVFACSKIPSIPRPSLFHQSFCLEIHQKVLLYKFWCASNKDGS